MGMRGVQQDLARLQVQRPTDRRGVTVRLSPIEKQQVEVEEKHLFVFVMEIGRTHKKIVVNAFVRPGGVPLGKTVKPHR